MNGQLVKRDTSEVVDMESINIQPLSAKEVKAQVNLIQQVMQEVMIKDTHYGVVPGCGNKPTLLKAGAEKLASTFRIALEPHVERIEDADSITFIVTTKAFGPSGNYLGSGVGMASTKEEKYQWRKAVNDMEYDATPEDKKRLKYGSKNNQDYVIKQIKTNPFDVANTVLKIGAKRSGIEIILKVTAASDIFTQDLEDDPERFAQAKEPAGKWSPSESQRKRLFAIGKSSNLNEGEMREILFSHFGVESTGDLTKEQYDKACDELFPAAGAIKTQVQSNA